MKWGSIINSCHSSHRARDYCAQIKAVKSNEIKCWCSESGLLSRQDKDKDIGSMQLTVSMRRFFWAAGFYPHISGDISLPLRKKDWLLLVLDTSQATRGLQRIEKSATYGGAKNCHVLLTWTAKKYIPNKFGGTNHHLLSMKACYWYFYSYANHVQALRLMLKYWYHEIKLHLCFENLNKWIWKQKIQFPACSSFAYVSQISNRYFIISHQICLVLSEINLFTAHCWLVFLRSLMVTNGSFLKLKYWAGYNYVCYDYNIIQYNTILYCHINRVERNLS